MKFGRTRVIIGPSKAKNHEESAGDVHFGVAAQKPRKNAQKRAKIFKRKIFGVKKSNVGNRLKRVFPKFHADRSEVRGVNGRSKFRKNV